MAAAKLAYTAVGDVAAQVAGARAAFQSGRTLSMKWRKKQLNGILSMVKDNEEAIVQALKSDLRRPKFEGVIMEVSTVIAEANHALAHVDEWVKPESVSTPLGAFPGSSYVQRQAKGVVFIVSPWNYPIQLILNPLVAVLAAGNTAVLKPSECSPACSALLGELVPKYLDADAIRVVQGAVPETTELLKHRADHIVYTGNPFVAKIVMRAAAEHLTPCTLELGGKSPAIVTAGADIPAAVRRIIQGRWANNGQTCLAPDYVLVDASIKADFLTALTAGLTAAYGEDAQASPSYGRIVNARHWDRLTALLASAKAGEEGSTATLAYGGASDKSDLYIEPAVVVDPSPDCALMTEEIFGPLLPVLGYSRLEDAVAFVNSRERPLALYVFAADERVSQKVMTHTTSGSVCVNDCLVQNGNPHLPFGGIGVSGMGAYHGKWGFDEFSHPKAVMHHPSYPLLDPAERYAPYSDKNIPLLRLLLEIDGIPVWAQALGGIVATGVVAGVAAAAGAF